MALQAPSLLGLLITDSKACRVYWFSTLSGVYFANVLSVRGLTKLTFYIVYAKISALQQE